MWKMVLEWVVREKAFRANQIQTRIRPTKLVQNVNQKAGNLIYFKTPSSAGSLIPMMSWRPVTGLSRINVKSWQMNH